MNIFSKEYKLSTSNIKSLNLMSITQKKKKTDQKHVNKVLFIQNFEKSIFRGTNINSSR